jgi:polysaccharide biosynthesis/export protein
MHKQLLFVLLGLTLASCSTLSPNRMFRTPKDYEFARDTTTVYSIPYLIRPGDKIELHIFSNDGFKLIDITQTGTTTGGTGTGLTYLVEDDGQIKFPVIGRTVVKGMTVKEAEDLLQTKYAKYYNDPFIMISIVNRHAIVFLGDGGKGVMVNLQNDNTTLYEALALAGGLTDFSKSYEIKILRGDPKNPTIYKSDLSTVEALKNSELRVFSNDIIYVDSGSNFRKRISADVVPLLSIVSSLLLIFAYFNNQ